MHWVEGAISGFVAALQLQYSKGRIPSKSMADDNSNQQDKLAAAAAILTAVTTAALTSGAPNSTVISTDSKREFGTVAYERLLPEGHCQCVERTTKKLQSLDNVVHVWVRDARSFRHGVDSTVPYFSLRVPIMISISELRALVQERFALISPYQKQVDGELQLYFDDCILDDSETFLAYLPGGGHSISSHRTTQGRSPSWPKPFAGILWVLPWRPSRKQPLQWGSSETAS